MRRFAKFNTNVALRFVVPTDREFTGVRNLPQVDTDGHDRRALFGGVVQHRPDEAAVLFSSVLAKTRANRATSSSYVSRRRARP